MYGIIKDKKLISVSDNNIYINSIILTNDEVKKLQNGCEYDNGVIETNEYKNNIFKLNIDKINNDRNNELKGFVIGNILMNDDIIKSMSVIYNVSKSTDTIEWIGEDNSIVSFSKADFGKLIKKGAEKIKEIYFRYRELKDNIKD